MGEGQGRAEQRQMEGYLVGDFSQGRRDSLQRKRLENCYHGNPPSSEVI